MLSEKIKQKEGERYIILPNIYFEFSTPQGDSLIHMKYCII